MSFDISPLVGTCPLSNFVVSAFATSAITKTAYNGNVGAAATDSWLFTSSRAVWTASGSSSWWFAQLHDSTATGSTRCRDFSYLLTPNTVPYIGVSFAKVSTALGSVQVGVDIGCGDAKVFKPLANLTPSNTAFQNYAVSMSSLTAAELSAIKAIVLLPSGQVGGLGIANLQVTCGPKVITASTSALATTSRLTTTAVVSPSPSPSICSASPVNIQNFNTAGNALNLLGGDSGTGGTGTYTIASGVATWTPTISASTAYWYSLLHSNSAIDGARCVNLANFGSSATLSLRIGKTTSSAATLAVGVDIGCGSTKVFKSLGTAVFAAGASTRVVSFKLVPVVTLVELSQVKAIVITASSGSVPSGTVFTLDDVQINCGVISTSTLPTTTTLTTTLRITTTVPVTTRTTTAVSPTTTSRMATTTTSTTTLTTARLTTTVQSPSPSPISCPVAPLAIQNFSSGTTVNLLSGDSGTGGTGGYTITSGLATWTPTISATTAYWYTQLHSASAADGSRCRNLYSFGSTAAVSIRFGKTTASAASIVVGVDIGCGSSKVFRNIGTAVLNAGTVNQIFVFDILNGLSSPSELQSVKAIVLLAVSGSVPAGSVITLDDIQITCSGSVPSPLPSPARTTTSQSPSPSPSPQTSPVPLCNANGGSDLARIPGTRPRVISRCTKPGQFALTFDDGPRAYESQLVSKLNGYGIKVTFFLNTNNWVDASGQPYSDWIKQAFNSGHQIASHTATHPDLTTLSNSAIISNLQQAENVINNLIGRRPAMMRPPYGSYNNEVLKAIDQAGYTTAVMWNLDTRDWEHNDANQSMAYVRTALETNCPVRGSASILELSHSTLESSLQFVDLLVPYVRQRGYTFVTLAECTGSAAYK